ncbi:MAG: MBL fold metallo-hydrolase, partial [bacterium]
LRMGPTSSWIHIGIIILYFLGFFLIVNFNVLKYRKYLLFLLLLCLNILIWKSGVDNHSSRVQWIQFDVGQGDAALLITPRRKTVLIDGGLKSSFFDNGKQIISVYLNKKGLKKINYVILTHPHSDHVGGLLHIIENFNIDRIYYSNCPYETAMYSSFLKAVKQRNIELYEVTSPDSLILSTCKLYFLSPSKHQKNETKKVRFNVNNQSLVTCFMYGRTKILFMGDAEREIEQHILQRYHSLQCNVIKIGHHGSSTSSTYAFLKQVDPDLGIISVGENNRFHLPSELVLQYLELFNIDIHRTDKQGAAVLISNGSIITKVDWK